MLDNLEALSALAATGTMTRAARRLRITQSAVSKRIASLEDTVGARLIEPDGRRVRLTSAGRQLLDRVGPLLVELRYAIGGTRAEVGGIIALGVSESVLASWGPRALAGARKGLPELELAIHSHRSPIAVDRVRAGEYQLALVAGSTDTGPDLSEVVLGEEEMVLVGKTKPRPLRRGRTVSVLSIEATSGTWRAISDRLRVLSKQRGFEINVGQTVESFACAVQMARAGFGVGLVPVSIARALGIPRSAMVPIPGGLTRPIAVVGRAATLKRPLAARFVEELERSVAAELGR